MQTSLIGLIILIFSRGFDRKPYVVTVGETEYTAYFNISGNVATIHIYKGVEPHDR